LPCIISASASLLDANTPGPVSRTDKDFGIRSREVLGDASLFFT
jgi:hypothetical protein